MQTIDTTAKPEVHALDLAVTVEAPMDIRVGAGAFKIEGTDYEFDADHVHTCTADPTDTTMVVGWIQKDKASGNVELVIDEVVQDGADQQYQPDRATKLLLHRLFQILVPAAATSITNETLRVARIIAPEE